MLSDPHPSMGRRRVRMALRQARHDADLSQRQVASDLGWSVSKVLRIEAGQVGISRTDLKALLALYGITEPTAVKDLVSLADGNQRGRWSAYNDILKPEFRAYLTYEDAATALRQFELVFIPGVLQTSEYADAVIESMADAQTTAETKARQKEFRMARQEILDRPGGPEFHFIIDEAAIRRGVGLEAGDSGVMTDQLRRLTELNARPGITIQILPFTAGASPGLRGSFVVLRFAEPDDGVVYLEGVRGSTIARDDRALVDAHDTVFARLQRLACPAADLDAFVDRVVRDLKNRT